MSYSWHKTHIRRFIMNNIYICTSHDICYHQNIPYRDDLMVLYWLNYLGLNNCHVVNPKSWPSQFEQVICIFSINEDGDVRSRNLKNVFGMLECALRLMRALKLLGRWSLNRRSQVVPIKLRNLKLIERMLSVVGGGCANGEVEVIGIADRCLRIGLS